MKILLFLLINCYFFIYSSKAEENEVDFTKNLRFFYYGTHNLFFYAKLNVRNSAIFIPIRDARDVLDVDYHVATRTLYWTRPGQNYNHGYPRVQPALLAMWWDFESACDDYLKFNVHCGGYGRGESYNHPSFRVLHEEDWNPRSLAVDNVGNKIYTVNTGEWSINVFDLEGKNKATIFENEYLVPLEIALDSFEGLIFLFAANTQTGSSQIYRMNMDGTKPQLIVNSTGVFKEYLPEDKIGFTVNTSKKRIYFGNFNDGKIEIVDYLGFGRITVAEVEKPRSISIYKRNLFYYVGNEEDNDDDDYKYKTPFRTCKLNDQGICITKTIRKLPAFKKGDQVNAIKPIGPHLKPQISNPCEMDNGGCQHHCLLKSSNDTLSKGLTFGCVCNRGYRLLPDLKNCTREKMLSAYDQAYLSYNKNFTDIFSSSSVDNIFPISIKLLTRLLYNEADSVYTGTGFNFFKYSDVISKAGSSSSDEDEYGNDEYEEESNNQKDEKKDDNQNNSTKLIPVVAYDWITKNHYYIKSSDDNEMVDLMVLKYNELETKSLKHSIEITLTKMHQPIFMTMHPYKGLLFAILKNNSILRLNSDGTNKVLLPNINNSVALAIDFNDDKLYWSNVNGAVWLSDLDGSNVKQLLKFDWNDSKDKVEKVYMYVYGEYLYIKSNLHKKIRRYHKINGEMFGESEIDDEDGISEGERIGIKVTAKDAQYRAGVTHPCLLQNGGCGAFCFGVPSENGGEIKRVCACTKLEDFLKFGVKCKKEKEDTRIPLFYYGPEMLLFTKNHTVEKPINIGAHMDMNIMAMDYHASKNMLYWISPREGYWTKKPKLYAMTWDYKNIKTDEEIMKNLNIRILREEETWNPKRLAIDYAGDKLYIADVGDKTVNVLDLNGKNKAIIFKNESLVPYDIALDYFEGLMFILAVNTNLNVTQIYRMNMDGSEVQLIVDDADIATWVDVWEIKSGFTLDLINKRIYFANIRRQLIELVDYTGKKRLNVVTKIYFPSNINVYKNVLYWSNHDDNVYLGNKRKDYSQKMCHLDENGICTEISTEKLLPSPIDNTKILSWKPIDPLLESPIINPCKGNQSGCQHHCLLKSSKSANEHLNFSCICNRGYRLAPNLKNCIEEEEKYEFISDQTYIPTIIQFNNLTQTIPLSRDLLIQLIYSGPDTIYHDKPFKFFQVSKLGDALLDISLGPRDREVCHRSRPVYCQINYLKANKIINSLITYEHKSIAKTIAYDWITRNLYFVNLTDSDTMGELIVLKFNNSNDSNNKSVSEKSESKLNSMILVKINAPRFMTVHPRQGYLFISLSNSSTIRLNTDGSDGILLPNIKDSQALAIDFDEDKLFWIDELYTIRQANFDGSDTKVLHNVDWGALKPGPIYMYVNEEYIYIKASALDTITRYNKKNGEYAGVIQIAGINFYQENIPTQVLKKRNHFLNKYDHPCAVNNGDCERLCFGVSKFNQTKLEKICT